MFDGDSLTAGSALTIPPDITYPDQTATLIGNFVAQNYGIGGQSMAQMKALGVERIDPLYNPAAKRTIVIAWGGTNDLAGGSSAATTYANIKAYCQARKNAGWRVVVLGLLPRSNAGLPGTFETSRQTIRTNMLADFPTTTGQTNIWTGGAYADYFIDLGADTNIGAAGSETNTTYYKNDRIHLNSTGNGVVAVYVSNAYALFP